MMRARSFAAAFVCLTACNLLLAPAVSAEQPAPSTVSVAEPVPLRPGDAILGPLADAQPLHVVVSLKLRNEGVLDAFIEAISTPNAVMTRNEMSSEEFLENHAPTEQDAAAVADFLSDTGFQDIEIAPNRLLVSAYAPASIVQAAFATSLVSVQTADNRVAYANNDAVHVPAELQDIVLSVVGLQTVHMKHTMLRQAQVDVVQPQPLASATGHNPKDWPIVYGASSMPVASTIPVGVVTEGNMTNTKNNLLIFTTANGLPTQTVQVVGSGGSDTSGDGEWALDTQDIVAMTGGVQKLILYDSASLFDSDLDVAFNAAVSANATKIISVSLGACETGSPIATEDLIFKAAVAKGQTFVFSSGDDGADECGDGGTTPSYPASSQYVVAVGGTTVFTNGTTWSSETTWGGTGGSPSKVEPIPTWQKNVGQNGTSTKRGVPDIAFAGDPNSGSIITLGSSHPQVGGTSLSAPLFAGAWARLMQAKGSNLGFAAPLIYQIAAVPSQYASDFHDVTSGNNTGETAAVGWDYTTGFGSMIVGQFANHLGVVSTPAAKLAFTVQPAASYASGATFTVKVSVETAAGAVVTTDTSAVTLALSGGTAGATLSGTKTVNAVAGVATFSNLSVDKLGTAYHLGATDGALTAASSSNFNITAGAASSLTFSLQPGANSNNTAKQPLPLTVHAQDAGANPVAGQSITLSIGANPGGSTLAVTANPVVTDSNGNATFNGVSLDKVGSGYTLKATDTSTPLSITSNSFNIVAGVATSMVFTTQPASNANIAVGANIPLIAHVSDAGGNAVANQNISLVIANNPGSATLSVTGNPVATNTFGDAHFDGVSLNKVGTGYTLKVTDNSVAALSTTGNAFNIVAGPPTQLSFVQQPGNGVAGVALSPAVTVQVRDAQGNLVVNDTHSVTLSIVAGPGPFDPGATVTVAFVGGVATFDTLLFDVAGTGYQLGASDSGDALTAAPSSTFTIAPGAPRLIFSTEPIDLTRGNSLGTIGVTEDDGSGNVVPDSASTVDFSIAACGGTVDLGSVQLSNGVATLTSTQRFYAAATGLVINAGTGVLNGSSRKFNVLAGDLIFADGYDGCRL